MIWKAVVLEVVWVLDEVVAHSEVAKPVSPSELVLVCWGYSDAIIFHFESVVAVAERVIFVGVVEMCYCARCGQPD